LTHIFPAGQKYVNHARQIIGGGGVTAAMKTAVTGNGLTRRTVMVAPNP